MRLSFLFSLVVAAVAILFIAQRVPTAGRASDSASNPGAITRIIEARSTQDAGPRSEAPPPVLPARGRLYRWRDASGSFHYQTEPPPAEVRADVIPFVRRQAVAAQNSPPSPPSPADGAPDLGDALPAALSVYTPEGFDDLMQRVEETAVKLRDRDQYLETLADQL